LYGWGGNGKIIAKRGGEDSEEKKTRYRCRRERENHRKGRERDMVLGTGWGKKEGWEETGGEGRGECSRKNPHE